MLLRLSLALLCFMPMLSHACSCIRPWPDREITVEEEVINASAVIEAEVLALLTIKNQQLVIWKVSRSWKGPHHAQSYVLSLTNIMCCMCGRAVQKGYRYLLYLYGGQPYSISTCSMSGTFPTADKQVRVLEALRKPEFAKPNK